MRISTLGLIMDVVRSIEIRDKISQEVRDFAQETLPDEGYFVCIYGSYATSHFRADSDLDIVFAADSYNPTAFEDIKDFVVSQHVRHGLTIDEEVPYSNKLLVTYQDVSDAASLDVFSKNDTGEYVVPEIKDDTEFLGSPDARKRLLLNAFTTPHVFVCGDKTVYEGLKRKCEYALVRLARGMSKIALPSEIDILETLLTSPEGNGGRAHLGYKGERDEVVTYLRGLIRRTVKPTSMDEQSL